MTHSCRASVCKPAGLCKRFPALSAIEGEIGEKWLKMSLSILTRQFFQFTGVTWNLKARAKRCHDRPLLPLIDRHPAMLKKKRLRNVCKFLRWNCNEFWNITVCVLTLQALHNDVKNQFLLKFIVLIIVKFFAKLKHTLLCSKIHYNFISKTCRHSADVFF